MHRFTMVCYLGHHSTPSKVLLSVAPFHCGYAGNHTLLISKCSYSFSDKQTCDAANWSVLCNKCWFKKCTSSSCIVSGKLSDANWQHKNNLLRKSILPVKGKYDKKKCDNCFNKEHSPEPQDFWSFILWWLGCFLFSNLVPNAKLKSGKLIYLVF